MIVPYCVVASMSPFGIDRICEGAPSLSLQQARSKNKCAKGLGPISSNAVNITPALDIAIARLNFSTCMQTFRPFGGEGVTMQSGVCTNRSPTYYYQTIISRDLEDARVGQQYSTQCSQF